MSCEIINRYRKFYRDQGDAFLASDNPDKAPTGYLKYNLADHIGRGWVDMYQINHGLTIGRGCMVFCSPWQCEQQSVEGNLSLYILLNGRVRVSDARRVYAREFSGGAMLIHEHHQPEPCAFRYEQMPGCQFEGISIEVPAALVEELRAEAGKNRQSGSLPDMARLNPQHQCYQYGVQVARMILNLSANFVVGRLQVEAAALDLVARICSRSDLLYTAGQALPSQQRIAVDEVRYILESEFNKMHTITSLSRRVRLNECYLKAAFRKITGYTIAEYLRKQRMEQARYLIEKQQVSVLHAALTVGYSNPSHFTAAFRAVYGVLPSTLKRFL